MVRIRHEHNLVSNHKPRKGTETIPAENVFRVLLCNVSNHKPRKGTETLPSSSTNINSSIVSNHKPRKGTETMRRMRFDFYMSLFQITNPARGRKHLERDLRWGRRTDSFKSQPPQGDGNRRIFLLLIHTPLVSNHKPRKGTETLRRVPSSSCHAPLFQITNPARGRKPEDMQSLDDMIAIVSNHKPRKGTETPRLWPPSNPPTSVSNHKPRKGTETR